MTTDTDTTRPVIIPDVQLRVARAFARALGHEWSDVPDEINELGAITQFVRERWESWNAPMWMRNGQECPLFAEGTDTIVHTSASNRFEYGVQPDGSWTIRINRRTGAVISVTAIAADATTAVVGYLPSDVRLRHFHAACRLLNNIFTREEVDALLADVRAAAEANDTPENEARDAEITRVLAAVELWIDAHVFWHDRYDRENSDAPGTSLTKEWEDVEIARSLAIPDHIWDDDYEPDGELVALVHAYGTKYIPERVAHFHAHEQHKLNFEQTWNRWCSMIREQKRPTSQEVS